VQAGLDQGHNKRNAYVPRTTLRGAQRNEWCHLYKQ
jgi:hypothetical protein